jgi:hypothetical protein
MTTNGADRRKLVLVPALALALVGLWLAALAGAENQPTVRQGAYNNTCDSPTQSEDTKITDAPKKKTKKSKAKFEFVGFYCGTGDVDDQDNYEFECKLDSKPYKGCSSPETYRGLKKGKHKFRVYAHFPNSDGDPTPAKHGWKIVD